jgi:hypothetical protein
MFTIAVVVAASAAAAAAAAFLKIAAVAISVGQGHFDQAETLTFSLFLIKKNRSVNLTCCFNISVFALIDIAWQP